MNDCKHKAYDVAVKVDSVHVKDENGKVNYDQTEGYIASIKIRCKCGVQFEFCGIPDGLSYKTAGTLDDFTTLTVPMMPVKPIKKVIDKNVN